MKRPAGAEEEPAAEDKPAAADEANLEILSQRLQRLEDAIASLQDTRALEDRVFERVRQRTPKAPEPAPETEERVFDRKKTLIPLIGHILAPPPPVKESTAAESSAATSHLPPVVVVREGLFLLDLWHEFRAIFAMFFDRRYGMAWSTRLTTLILVPVILFSQFWMPMGIATIPIVGAIFDNFINLVLGFFLYKVLSREARKYMQARGQEVPHL
jgi:hypothetical protein